MTTGGVVIIWITFVLLVVWVFILQIKQRIHKEMYRDLWEFIDDQYYDIEITPELKYKKYILNMFYKYNKKL